MFFRKYLSSLRTTYIFMVCFGLLMGLVFPFYSWLFFGAKAFAPLYVIGCLAAGFTVGSFCYHVIKEALKLYVGQQLVALGRITGDGTAAASLGRADQLQQLMECNEALMNRVYLMVENVSRLAGDIAARHGRLTAEFGEMVTGNENQAVRGRETVGAVTEMNRFFGDLLGEIDAIATRSEERAALSTEMTSATDDIALNITEYSSLVMELSASIEQMAMSIRETTVSTQALTDSTEQTYHSINTIGASISNVRDNAHRSSHCSAKVMVEATEGMQAMAATIATMKEIEKTSDSSVEANRRLSRYSLRVEEFLKVIRDVVTQTNLLSLNASIIAAQAGESGKAFAVVADEVRGLASRTSSSTSEIEELVSNIHKETAAAEKAAREGKDKVAEGVVVSEGAREALKRIQESAAEASTMAHQIAASTDEQASASALITEEAEKNLERFKQLSMVILEEEKGAGLILRGLEDLRGFTRKIAASTDEQARGNRLYMQSVLDDNAKMKRLKDTCIEQIAMGDLLRKNFSEVDRLIEANAGEARRMMSEINMINATIVAIEREMAAFRNPSLPPGNSTPLSLP